MKKTDTWGGETTPEQYEEIQKYLLKMEKTYIWKEKDSDFGFLPVDEIKICSGNTKYSKLDIETVQLFEPLDKSHYDSCVRVLNKYFIEILCNNPADNIVWISLDEIRFIILPKAVLKAINVIITEHNLDSHRDFILFLVAKIQKEYISEIEFSETDDERIRVNKFPKELGNLIVALEQATNNNPTRLEDINNKLNQIRFRFYGKVNAISISDRDLMSFIIEAIKKGFYSYQGESWESEIKSYRHTYNENLKYFQFRQRLAIKLNDFFINEKLDIVKKPYCIGRIIDVASVPIYRPNKAYEINVDEVEITNTIEKWLSRKTV
ncbi:MAG: hypothetical protein Q8Q51_11675 [Lutibacter sp.]|nr:hypothetical protein [Lutibacter sp.]